MPRLDGVLGQVEVLLARVQTAVGQLEQVTGDARQLMRRNGARPGGREDPTR